MKTIPVAYLKECFSYDPKSGVLVWKERPRSHFSTERSHRTITTRTFGKQAGSLEHGYLVVGVTYKGKFRKYPAHRIAWALHYGEWPSLSIDHIDGNPANNKIDNLRECSHVQNMANQGARSKKTGRLKGAYFHKRSGKWQASICVAYQQMHLGYFDSEEEAHAAYTRAAAELQGQFSRAK